MTALTVLAVLAVLLLGAIYNALDRISDYLGRMAEVADREERRRAEFEAAFEAKAAGR